MSIVESDVDTLTVYAEQVLATTEVALAATDEGVPPLSYTTAGLPAYDCCPALMVYVAGLYEAPTVPSFPAEATARRVVTGSVTLATYLVTVLRCAANPGPGGSSPSPSAMMIVAAQVQQDMWAVWNGLRNAVRNGEIFETCQGVHFDGIVPIREQGGCVGMEATLRAMIPGIPNPMIGT